MPGLRVKLRSIVFGLDYFGLGRHWLWRGWKLNPICCLANGIVVFGVVIDLGFYAGFSVGIIFTSDLDSALVSPSSSKLRWL
jgi:hypothetical protein